jgi:hypothetical protein
MHFPPAFIVAKAFAGFKVLYLLGVFKFKGENASG